MKITGTSGLFLPLFQAHSHLSRNVIDELEYVKIIFEDGKLYSLATDLENSIIAVLEGHKDRSVPGDIIIAHARLVCDYLQKLPPEQKLSILYDEDTNKLTIECISPIKGKYMINGPQDPSLSSFSYLEKLRKKTQYEDFEHHVDEWQWDYIKGLLTSCLPNSSVRPILSGINIRMSEDKQFFELASTDSVRAAVLKIDNNGDKHVLNSPTMQMNVLKILSSIVKLRGESENELTFAFIEKGEMVRFLYTDGVTGVKYYVYGRNMAGEYPNVRSIIPESLRNPFLVSKQLLLGCIARFNRVTKDSLFRLNIDIQDTMIHLSSGDLEFGNLLETIAVKSFVPGTSNCSVSVNVKLLEDNVKNTNSDYIVLDFPVTGHKSLCVYATTRRDDEYVINEEVVSVLMLLKE